jgi:integrase
MARRRFQTLKPERKGKFWWVRKRVDVFIKGVRTRQQKRIKLGPVSAMSYRDAQRTAKEEEIRLNQGVVTAGSGVQFSEFVETTYIPTTLPLLASTTQTSYMGMFNKYLMPTFEGACLGTMTHLSLQRYFSSLSGQVSHAVSVKVRDTLSSILRAAVKYDFLQKNPVDGLDLPPNKAGRKAAAYVTPEQFDRLVEIIAEPYATMLYVAVWTGLRVSELIALKWRNIHTDSIAIEQRFSRGDWSVPKTKASAATIGVEPHVIARIQRLKSLTIDVQAGCALRHYSAVKSGGQDDLVFQSVKEGKPMNDQNILKRHIKPAAGKLGLSFVNWRCLRTSHATWLVQAGADPKSVQGQMRHSRISTTLDIYAQIVPATQRRALERLTEFAGNKSAQRVTVQ